MLKVEFGAGHRIPKSRWTCHDWEVDITVPLPYANNTVDEIRAEHVCEHVSGPQFLRFLDECRRILIPGGRVRISMPVLCRLSDEKRRDIILNHGHQAAYTPDTILYFFRAAGFININPGLPRDEIDNHWGAIGIEQDDLETYRIEGIK